MRSTILAVSMLGLLSSACSMSRPLTEWVQPHRIDVRQGNYVDQGMASQLKKGMTREQVRFILGTPLIADPFHADRWDYVYLFRPGRGEAEERRLTLRFVADRLDRVEGDVTAGSGEAAAEPPASRVLDLSGGGSAPAK